MNAAQAVVWLIVGPAVAVCGGIAAMWACGTVLELRRRQRQAEKYALDRRVSERLKEAARQQIAPRKDEGR